MIERLERLENNMSELRGFRERHSAAEVQASRELQWALRYGLLESIQAVIDISCHLCVKYNLGNPESYSECIELLTRFQYVLPALSENLLGMVGLRNLLVHEYVRLDTGRLYGLLESVDDFAHFVEAVRDSV